jgi:glucokinase
LELNPQKRYIIGVDIGGTNTRASVAEKDGRILSEGHRPTKAMDGPDESIPQIIDAIREAIENGKVSASDICGIGMGVPGRHKTREGIVLWSPNFKDWAGLQLLQPFRDAFGVPVFMGNDVNVAALGEFRFGAGSGVNSMVMLTLGTGIGGGIILDGKLWKGANEGAGEIGHQIINPNGRLCGCGRYGDLESEANQGGIIERARRKIQMGRKTSLVHRVEGDPDALTPEIIAEAAFEGDELSLEVLQETGYFVGIGVANAINLLNPEMVVIGGGIARAGFVLWDPIMRTVKANALAEALEVCQVVPSELRDDAGILGGVTLVLEEIESCA